MDPQPQTAAWYRVTSLVKTMTLVNTGTYRTCDVLLLLLKEALSFSGVHALCLLSVERKVICTTGAEEAHIFE